MNRKSYEKKIRITWYMFAAVIIIAAVLIYFYSEDFFVTSISAAAMLIITFLAYIIYRLDDIYIIGVVDDLAKLTDMLIELEEKKVFEENQDTMLSKLQSKIVKLTRIIKKRNETSLKEKENIKMLVSDISHQLKTPIANLKIYMEFLEDTSLAEETRIEYVEIVSLAVERLNYLSESMIKISRLESGLIQLDMHEQSLNETVLKAVKAVYTNAKKNHNEIIYMEESEIIMNHDRNWTSEAVFNLLDNAVKYSSKGAKIYLSIKSFGRFSAIEVKDENQIISEDEKSKIFSRFYRGKGSHDKDGIGVGLYLAREIIIKQGGYINLKGYDNGNIFSIML